MALSVKSISASQSGNNKILDLLFKKNRATLKSRPGLEWTKRNHFLCNPVLKRRKQKCCNDTPNVSQRQGENEGVDGFKHFPSLRKQTCIYKYSPERATFFYLVNYVRFLCFLLLKKTVIFFHS